MMRRGFTLIEILVATAIFMTVMVVAVGIFGTTMGSSSTSSQLRNTAQTSRYVFESMAREIRSAHGLVEHKVDPASGAVTQEMVIKPFDYDETAKTVRVNHVKKVRVDDNGQNRYMVTQKLYKWTTGLMLEIYESEETDMLISEVRSATYKIKNPGGTSLIPDDQVLDKIGVIAWQPYVANPDDQEVQPFIRLTLTIANKAGNFARQVNQKAQTTLQTTIVPRDFISQYEVAQTGVGGGE